MAFINVIKCTYKIWSRSEIIWAKKIKRKNLSSPKEGIGANYYVVAHGFYFSGLLIIKWVHN